MLLIVQIRFCFVISYWPQCQGRFSLCSSRLLQLLEGLCTRGFQHHHHQHHCHRHHTLTANSKTPQSCPHVNLVITDLLTLLPLSSSRYSQSIDKVKIISPPSRTEENVTREPLGFRRCAGAEGGIFTFVVMLPDLINFTQTY